MHPLSKKGVKFKKQTENFFQKSFGRIEKRLYLCTRFQNERAQKETEIFLKKIWSIEKKVIPLHPQTKRQVH